MENTNIEKYYQAVKEEFEYNQKWLNDAKVKDARNVKNQCVDCNFGGQGRADNFYLHLIEDYGLEEADRLRKRAKWNAYSRTELQEIINTYKPQQIKSL